jgi:circadian clock protein KaiC
MACRKFIRDPGLDQVTHRGFPKARTTLVCRGPRAGKALLGLEFLVHGAELYGAGVGFEQTVEELTTNMALLGHNLNSLVKSEKAGD